MGNCYSKNYKTELVNYEYADLLIDHFIQRQLALSMDPSS